MDFFIGFLKCYWSYFLNVILLLALICTSSFILLKPEKERVIEPIAYVDEEKETTKIYVDVKGAVKKPGVYEMDSINIINDVIEKAGGFTAKAYKNNINLSKKINDEMVIYVYTKTEFNKLNENDTVEQVICNCDDYVIDSCTNTGSSIITTDENPNQEIEVSVNKDSNNKVEDVNAKVCINTATKEELMTLNGVGESKADSIIKYRLENGNFKTIEEIKNVSGIGDAAFEKIKDYITV